MYENNRVKYKIADYQIELNRNIEMRVEEKNTFYIQLRFSTLIIFLGHCARVI